MADRSLYDKLADYDPTTDACASQNGAHGPTQMLLGTILLTLVLSLSACVGNVITPETASQVPPLAPTDAMPTPQLAGIARERREVHFQSGDATLAGELDLPSGDENAPLVFIIHHSGPVTRDAYGYMAEILLPEGFAVFRFDKRGTGYSTGEYGCCEADDALAAYQAAVSQAGINRERVFIVAQSIGTQHLAGQFAAFQAIQPPQGVALLSNLLGPEEITAVAAPILVIVADSEPDLARVGPGAVAAHREALPFGASLYVAEGAEHTLFDITDGPIDWSDPAWVTRYHRGAIAHLEAWLRTAMVNQVMRPATTPTLVAGE
ncbi:MAG: alpha/beta hydrolase [Chloroflexaceae bacterium]